MEKYIVGSIEHMEVCSGEREKKKDVNTSKVLENINEQMHNLLL